MPANLRRWAARAFWPPGRRRIYSRASAESWRTGNSAQHRCVSSAVDASPYYAPGPTAPPPSVAPYPSAPQYPPAGQTGERDPGLQPPLSGRRTADFARGLPDNLRNAAADLKRGRRGVEDRGSRRLKEAGGWGVGCVIDVYVLMEEARELDAGRLADVHPALSSWYDDPRLSSKSSSADGASRPVSRKRWSIPRRACSNPSMSSAGRETRGHRTAPNVPWNAGQSHGIEDRRRCARAAAESGEGTVTPWSTCKAQS